MYYSFATASNETENSGHVSRVAVQCLPSNKLIFKIDSSRATATCLTDKNKDNLLGRASVENNRHSINVTNELNFKQNFEHLQAKFSGKLKGSNSTAQSNKMTFKL